jgi:AcrR family transcriptional regulator
VPRRANIRPDEPGRQKVLEAGRELFAERGYHATSIAEIGERAAIAKSVMYHYFGSKAGLYEAVLETETTRLIDRVAGAVPDDPEAARLRPAVDAYLGFLRETPAAWQLLLRDAPADPALAEVHERLAAQRAQALAKVIASPGKRADAGHHVELVVTAIRAFAAWWYEHRNVPQAQVVDAIVEFARAGTEKLGPNPAHP